MNMKSKRFIYELFMMILALIVVIIATIQLIITLPYRTIKILSVIDKGIYIIFVLDYCIRLFISKGKWQFIKNHKIDLITIIPFSEVFISFRIFRFFRVTEVFKVTKALKATMFLNRLVKKIREILKTNNFYYVILITLILIFSSATFISIFEDISFKNALWWSFVTTTTVGYGDIAPKTDFGRSVAVILMLTGVTFMGVLTGTISTYFFRVDNKKNNISNYKREVIESIKNKLDDFDELSVKELRDIFKVLEVLKEEDD